MVTVFLAGGSADRGETAYSRAAREFGRRVAGEGWVLRTGGGSGRSVMGAATDGSLGAGGRVEGVILRKFWGIRHRGMGSMKALRTFSGRKAALFRGADAAVVFPGGYGTLDELGDLLTLKQTGFLDLPVLVVNVRGYFAKFLAWERQMGREGFLYGPRLFTVSPTPAAAIRRLKALLNTQA